MDKRINIYQGKGKKAVVLVFSTILFLIYSLFGEQPEKAEFSVALTGKYPPFSFYSENGQLVGFDADISRAIADQIDRKLTIITTEWDGILAGLLADKYDAIIGSMAITPERAKRVNFSKPYYTSGAQLFVHDDSDITKIEDADGRKIGVGLGETYEHYLRKNHPELQIIPYKSTVDIFQDMKNRRLDGFVTDRLVGLYQIKQGKMPFVPAGKLLYQEKIGIPVKKNRVDLLRHIDSALTKIRENGTLDKIHQKWFGKNREKKGVEKSITLASEIKILGKGFAITLWVAFISLVMGFLLAIPWGIALDSQTSTLYHVLRFLNDFIRGTPLLIQLFFVYFGAPQIGIVLTPINSAIITLTISCSAYMSEAIRSGLMSVDHGQCQAGRSLGLSYIQIFRFIVWPQAFRISIPSLMNIVVAFIKDTALISVISVSEVVREAQSIISVTYNPMKYYFIVAVMFFVVTFPLMKLAGNIEKRIKQKGFVYD